MTKTANPRCLASTALIGDTVRNSSGEELGEIADLMIDLNEGRVAYAVLSFGGFLGLGDKLFAVPWNAMRFDPEHDCFLLDVERERLENAPGFDKDAWPDFADAQFHQLTYDYYSTKPYWRT